MGWSWEGVGERVNVGEADVDGDVGVVLLRGDWDVGFVSRARADEFEKTVRSFWRERAGERRREGMVVVAWCGVARRWWCLVYEAMGLVRRACISFRSGPSVVCSCRRYIRLVSRKLVAMMIWLLLLSCVCVCGVFGSSLSSPKKTVCMYESLEAQLIHEST
jgi:hypothetical protein